jgi:opacity protein-like surface antigen
MRKLLFLAILIAATASMAFAQSTDYNKIEFYGGYSHARVDTGVDDEDFDDDFADFLRDRRGFNGFDTSITGNVSRYVGIKGNLTGHFKSDNFTDGIDTVNTKERIWNFLGGVQVKDNSKETRFKPFAHFLAGAAHQSIEATSPGIVGTFKLDDTSFALKAGAGIDIRVSDRVDIRAIEFDYNPIFIGDRTFENETFNGSTQHNFTVGFGIVIH